jgi:DEAD/DEAH box helicase domain-containing protein
VNAYIVKFRSSSSVASEAIDDPDHEPVDLASASIKPVPRKRKAATTSNIKGKGKANVPLSRNFVSSVEWPDHFKRLQKTFQAINTIYTFLSTRKHLASTYDNLKSSVQAIIKR